MTREPFGYTQADLDAVTDNPEWTSEDIARARPFSEAFPQLADKIGGTRNGAGSQGKADASSKE